MNKVDKQALREVAQNATQGEWVAFISYEKYGTYAVHTPKDDCCEDIINWPGFDGRENASANARYIAAANPATMLALLDENEALAAENERLKNAANEMQAQGVERCAAWFHDNHEYCRLLVTMMREFARHLRGSNS